MNDKRTVVFLRAVNVGRTNRCQPAVIAKHLSHLGLLNIGAVGTFVVREKISEPALRRAIAQKLPFTCEMMICSAGDLLTLAASDPFAKEPFGPNITRFVSVLSKPLRPPLPLSFPLALPTANDWLLRIVELRGRFLLGLYVRQIKAISYLGKIEKQLGVPVTTRSWNTIEKIVHVLTGM